VNAGIIRTALSQALRLELDYTDPSVTRVSALSGEWFDQSPEYRDSAELPLAGDSSNS